MKRRQRSMISRYHRRPVSHKLEIRGLSRSRLDKHPLPEEADDHQSPRHDLHDLQEPGSIHDSSETSAASGHSDCPTIVSVDSSRSWSGIRSSTGTGLSTERSSVFSWGYDEFDKAASRQVQQMFEEIDKELYEGRGAGAGILQGLQEECQQWATRFPHLRVVGTQVVRPGDEGFQWFATPGRSSLESSPSTAGGGGVGSPPRDPGSREWVPAGRIQTALTAFWLLGLWQSGRAPHPGRCVICVPFHVSFARVESLNVQGRRAALLQSSSARSDGPPGASSGSGSQHQQRVIEVEGLMEEYLAFDSRDPDDGCERDHSDSGDWRRCLPPVSPSRCRRQAVLDLLFDGVWQQLVGWMKELVQHRWECCTFGTPPGPSVNNNPAVEPWVWSAAGDKASGSLNPVQEDSQDPLLLSLEPATVAKVGHSRVPPIAAGHHAQNTKSGGSKHKSSREKQKRPSSAGRVPAAAAAAQHNLDDLMVIHSIPLQQRNLGLLDRNQDPEERQGHRSGSGTLPSGRPGPRRALEQSSASLSRPPPSARRRNPPPRTLLPLVPSPGQAGSIAEVIRGTRLPTANERLSRSRNTLLPPIGGSGAGDPDGPQPSKPAQQRQKGPSWTQSALNQEAGAPRERQHPPDACSRPNTTHTYRSDTPYRRSFTVLDVSQGRPGRASVATDALGIGVTGVSLGISSSSFLDAVSHHPLGHGLIRDGEEPRPQVSGPAPVGPTSTSTSTPVPLRSHARGGASSRASRTGP